MTSYIGVEKPKHFPILKVIGVFGLILIVLEAALDLSLVKEKKATSAPETSPEVTNSNTSKTTWINNDP